MIAETITLSAGALIVYHHALYPMLLAQLGKGGGAPPAVGRDRELPTATVVMSAFNEADHIRQKIANIASLDYPHHKLRIFVGCDGCTDATAERAKEVASANPGIDIRVWEFAANRGKVAVLNDLMAKADTGICIFTDVSAEIAHDAFRRLASHFIDPSVGAVGGGYDLHGDINSAGASYWSVQTAIKCGESRLGGLIGAHGALYAIRTECWRPLPPDTINDDFIVPMMVATDGWRTLYDPSCRAVERDAVGEVAELTRRKRIGAGNMQQCLRLIGRLSWRNPGLSVCFLSGKALRVFIPLLMLAALIGSLYLAPANAFFLLLALGQIGLYVAAILGYLFGDIAATRPAKLLSYLVLGHLASATGAVGYLMGWWHTGWSDRGSRPRPSARAAGRIDEQYLPLSVRLAKRTIDIVGSGGLLFLTLPLFPLIALMIKLESPGPVFFRQRRVGCLKVDRSNLFMMIKFRSMRQDAEKKSGAVWATKDDPRVTRVGRFLRNTRLDELPQLFNVLAGDMSLIGPRPERPELYQKLESNIPFYRERTYGLRPGITGLAQVNQGYDATIEDVRSKVMFDHAYAACSCRFLDWLRMEFAIAVRTVGVMGFGRGQ